MKPATLSSIVGSVTCCGNTVCVLVLDLDRLGELADIFLRNLKLIENNNVETPLNYLLMKTTEYVLPLERIESDRRDKMFLFYKIFHHSNVMSRGTKGVGIQQAKQREGQRVIYVESQGQLFESSRVVDGFT